MKFVLNYSKPKGILYVYSIDVTFKSEEYIFRNIDAVSFLRHCEILIDPKMIDRPKSSYSLKRVISLMSGE